MSRKNFSNAHGRAILPGQVWMRPCGELSSEWRVMAVAEGYAMGRYKGCMVSVAAVKDMDGWNLATFTSGEIPK